jgi:hypothetical protein
MSMKTITFEASEESIVTLDEIAVNLGESRDYILREALAVYLEQYEFLKANSPNPFVKRMRAKRLVTKRCSLVLKRRKLPTMKSKLHDPVDNRSV